jgi:outer membrane protein TolC
MAGRSPPSAKTKPSNCGASRNRKIEGESSSFFADSPLETLSCIRWQALAWVIFTQKECLWSVIGLYCEELIRDFMKLYHPIFLTALGSVIALCPSSVLAQAVAPEVGAVKSSPKPLKISQAVEVAESAPLVVKHLLSVKAIAAKPKKTLLSPLVTNPTPAKPLLAQADLPKLEGKPATTQPIVPSRLEANPTMIQPTFETPKTAVPVQPASPLPPARSVTPEVKPTPKPAPVVKPSETPLPPSKPPAPSGNTPTTPTPPPPYVATPVPTIVPKPVADPIGPAPGYVNPKAKALLYPTKPEEVKLLGVQPITLQQALNLAEKNNRDLAIARLQIEGGVNGSGGRAGVREAEASLYPTLDLQSIFSRSQSAGNEISVQAGRIRAIRSAGGQRSVAEASSPFNPNAGAAFRLDGNTTSTVFDATLQLNYNIFTSGQRSGQIKAAKQQLRSLELQYERIFEQLLFDVTDDYYSLQDADEQVAINEAAVLSGLSNLRDAEAQERAGLGTRFDVLRAQVQLANNTQQLTNSKGNRDIRRRQLAQRLSLSEVVGVVAGEEVQKASILQPLATPDGRLAPLENLIILAYNNRVELQEQVVLRDLSETQQKVALSALGPTVSLRGQYGVEKQFEQPVSGLADGYSLSVTAQWRLFDGGQARARAEQQVVSGLIAEERFAKERNQVRFQVEQAHSNILANAASIDTTEQAVRQAEEALRLAILRFQAGVGTQTDRINAESDLTRARGNRISAIIGYNRSLAQLRRAVSNTTSLPKYNKVAAQ